MAYSPVYQQQIGSKQYNIPVYYAPQGTDFSKQKTAFTGQIDAFAAQANDYARVILGKQPKLGRYKDTGSRFNPLSENFFIPFYKIKLNFFGGFGGTNVYVNNGNNNRRQDNTVALVCAGIGLLSAGAFATGLFYRKYNEASNKFDQNKVVAGNIRQLSQALPQVPTSSKLEAFANKYMKMLERNCNNNWWNLAISISILAGGAFLALGAAIGAGALTLGGGVLAAAAITVMLVRLGTSCGDTSVRDEAHELRDDWKEFKKQQHGTAKDSQMWAIDAQTGVATPFNGLPAYRSA